MDGSVGPQQSFTPVTPDTLLSFTLQAADWNVVISLVAQQLQMAQQRVVELDQVMKRMQQAAQSRAS